MVYRDHWALSRWYHHYARLLGPEALYIIAHGADPKIQQICPGASIITVPRETLSRFDRWRGQMMNRFQAGLLTLYDWVIQGDADELLCFDPDHWDSLQEVCAKAASQVLFALGCNVFDSPDAQVPPAFTAHFTGHYSKACAVGAPSVLKRHGIELPARRLANAHYVLPRGVVLAHLKYANRNAAEEMAAQRAAIAAGPEQGLPGRAWREAHEEVGRNFRRIGRMPHASFSAAEQEARDALAEPVRDEARSLLRSKSVRLETRFTLPDWMTDSIL